MTEWTVVVPVRGTPSAKSRLGGSAELALALALDTVDACLKMVPEPVGGRIVIVVTSAEVAPRFEALGARVVIDDERSLLDAIAQGIASAGTGPTAVLLGDLPALRSSELEAALALAARHPLAFVPDADDDGTVLITALDRADHRPAFGVHSRAAHLAAGYVELAIPLESGLRRDVDTAEQLSSLTSRLGPHTSALM